MKSVYLFAKLRLFYSLHEIYRLLSSPRRSKGIHVHRARCVHWCSWDYIKLVDRTATPNTHTHTQTPVLPPPSPHNTHAFIILAARCHCDAMQRRAKYLSTQFLIGWECAIVQSIVGRNVQTTSRSSSCQCVARCPATTLLLTCVLPACWSTQHQKVLWECMECRFVCVFSCVIIVGEDSAHAMYALELFLGRGRVESSRLFVRLWARRCRTPNAQNARMLRKVEYYFTKITLEINII